MDTTAPDTTPYAIGSLPDRSAIVYRTGYATGDLSRATQMLKDVKGKDAYDRALLNMVTEALDSAFGILNSVGKPIGENAADKYFLEFARKVYVPKA